MSSSDTDQHAIVLRKGRDAAPRRRRHPWVYRQAVAGIRGSPEPGALSPVEASDGTVIGWGFASPGSLIAIRMVSFGPQPPAKDWIEHRIRAAVGLRSRLGIDSDGMRLVNAEGDFIPGLVADRYGEAIVISILIKGVEREAQRIAACLAETAHATKVYHKRDDHYGRIEGLELASGYLLGDGDGTATIVESGVRMVVDYARGQKTGFYLDQRANRTLSARLASGRRVLNLFSYTGAFALRAAASGATEVVSVENSPRALELAARSAALNPELDPGKLAWVREDVFDWLAAASSPSPGHSGPRSGPSQGPGLPSSATPGSFDLVIADPPPFARRRAEVRGALRGYLSLNEGALRCLSPGGFLMSFSCSGAVDRQTFRQVLEEAVLRSGRSARLLGELHADVDHPVACGHPEGEYLKGWILHAE